MDKKLGIVGGLGSETSCSFCLNVNQAIKRSQGKQPQIILENVPISDQATESIANGEFSAEALGLLVDSVKRLNACKVNFIVIPCNTVHIFINDLRKISDVPILSIIEETAKECKNQSFTQVGVLGSTTTIKERLYATELQKNGISAIIPSKEDQTFVSACIIKILNQNTTIEDKQKMIFIIQEMQSKGAAAIILGCTDLFLLVSPPDVPLPLINSTQILENTVIEILTSNTEALEHV